MENRTEKKSLPGWTGIAVLAVVGIGLMLLISSVVPNHKASSI